MFAQHFFLSKFSPPCAAGNQGRMQKSRAYLDAIGVPHRTNIDGSAVMTKDPARDPRHSPCHVKTDRKWSSSVHLDKP